MNLRTKKARGLVALVGVWLFFTATFGTIQLLTGGGWWGYLLWTGVFALFFVLVAIVPRILRWIDSGLDHLEKR